MNVFRSLARELISLAGNEATKQTGEVGLRSALEKRVVPAVVDLGRYRDSFDRMPQNFQGAMNSLKGERAFTKSSWASLAMTPEVAAPSAQPSFRASSPAFASHLADGFESARRSPVDLSGGLKPAVTLAAQKPASRSNGFTASLADL
ncbi:MAG: hypothetical protein GQE15_03695 [Archangiaceae bacterium]|nr:hypothetical protein [Archangiaceae bacterium]